MCVARLNKRNSPPLAPSPMSTSGACAGGPKAEIAMVDDDEVSGSEAQRHGWHGSPCSAPPLARRPSGERVQLHLLGERLLPQTGELLLSSFPGERRLPQLGELLLPAVLDKRHLPQPGELLLLDVLGVRHTAHSIAAVRASLQVAHLHVTEFQHRGLPHAHIHTFIQSGTLGLGGSTMGSPQALPALPDDVLRSIWQAMWRTEAASVIQQIWRDGADRRRRRRVNTRNIMRAWDAYEEHIDVERVQSILYLIKYVHKGEGPYWFITF